MIRKREYKKCSLDIIFLNVYFNLLTFYMLNLGRQPELYPIKEL